MQQAAVATDGAWWHGTAVVLWIVIGLAGVALDAPATNNDDAQLWMSCAALFFGCWVFWVHGRNQITAPGLYSLASAMFVGFAGLWWWNQEAPVSYDTHVATIVGYWVNLGMFMFFWRPNGRTLVSSRGVTSTVTQAGIVAGLALSTIAFGIWFIIGSGNALVHEAGFAGLSLLMVSLIHHRSPRPRLLRQLALGAAVVGLYSQTLFSGYGRLILVSLALVPVILLSGQLHQRGIKAVVLGGMGPAVAVLSAMRESFGVQTYGHSLDGMGSIVEPLRDFGRLVAAHDSGSFSFDLGGTFWASATAFMPRSIWPSKPIGFGAELTQLFNPSLTAIGQSYAALSQGEWYFNFGWFGVAAMVPVLGCLIRLLDNWFNVLRSQPIKTARQLVWTTIAILAVADIPNLMWVGTFGYTSRTGFRIAVLLPLLILLPARLRGKSGVDDFPEALAEPRTVNDVDQIGVHPRNFGDPLACEANVTRH